MLRNCGEDIKLVYCNLTFCVFLREKIVFQLYYAAICHFILPSECELKLRVGEFREYMTALTLFDPYVL